MNKKYLIFVFFLPFIFLISFVSSACGPGGWEDCDYYINDTDSEICLYNGNYTYILNMTDWYNWAAGSIGDETGSDYCTYRLTLVSWANSTTLKTDYVCMDQTDYYYSIPYDEGSPTLYSFNDTLVFETNSLSVYPHGAPDSYLEMWHLDSGSWSGNNTATRVWNSSGDDLWQSTTCGFPYPTTAEYYASGPCSNCLLTYYKLDDVGAITIDNQSYYNASNEGCTAQTSGYINYSYDFERSQTDYVYLSYDYDYADFSVCMWINPETSSSTRQHLFHVDGSSLSHGTKLLRLNSGTIESYFGGAVANYAWTDTGEWIHICAVRNATANYLYVNGTLRDTDTVGTTTSGTYAYSMGCDALGNTSNCYDGKMDDVRLYNYDLTSSEVFDIYNQTEEGGGEGGANLTWIANMTNITLSFNDSNYTNLSNYFQNWYELALVYYDPYTDNQTAIITGMGTVNSDYWEAYLGTVGAYDNLTLTSYEKNDSSLMYAVACDNSSIDTWCPVAGFPGTCNISRLLTDESCFNTDFYLNIIDYYVAPVTWYNTFELYYQIPNLTNHNYSMAYYFNNFNRINVTWYDITNASNFSLGCDLAEGGSKNTNGFLNVSMYCNTNWTIYLDVVSNNQSGNSTFYVTGSNSNNSLSDYFIVLTGNYSGYGAGNGTSEFLNVSSFHDLFNWTDDAFNDNMILLAIFLGVLVFSVLFICIPLKFNKFSIFITLIFLWLVALFFASGDRLSWLWVVVPPSLFIVYYVIKSLMGGGK